MWQCAFHPFKQSPLRQNTQSSWLSSMHTKNRCNQSCSSSPQIFKRFGHRKCLLEYKTTNHQSWKACSCGDRRRGWHFQPMPRHSYLVHDCTHFADSGCTACRCLRKNCAVSARSRCRFIGIGWQHIVVWWKGRGKANRSFRGIFIGAPVPNPKTAAQRRGMILWESPRKHVVPSCVKETRS